MLETLHLKAMLQFNIEIVKQVKFQMRVKALIPTWGSAGRGGGGRRVGRAGRANMQAIRDEVAQEDCTDDSDSQVALTRLVQLRKSRETCMRLLASSLESKETLSNNLSACIDCKNNLENKLRLDSRGLPASLDSAASIAEKEAKMNEQVRREKRLDCASWVGSVLWRALYCNVNMRYACSTYLPPLSFSLSLSLSLSCSFSNQQRMKDFLANENDSSYGGLDRTWYSSNCHIVCNNGRELLRRITLCTDLIFTSNEKLQHMVEVREDMNNLQLQVGFVCMSCVADFMGMSSISVANFLPPSPRALIHSHTHTHTHTRGCMSFSAAPQVTVTAALPVAAAAAVALSMLPPLPLPAAVPHSLLHQHRYPQ